MSILRVRTSNPSLSGRRTPEMITPPCHEQFFNFSRPQMLRRQSSMSSVTSLTSEDDDEDSYDAFAVDEFTQEEEYMMSTALDEFMDSAACNTPFVGVPPTQLIHTMARAVLRKKGSEWRHTSKATRTRLMELAREKAAHDAYGHDEAETPIAPADPDATPRRTPAKRRQPLARQNSMDRYMPPQRDGGHTLNRLSNKLHQTTSPYSRNLRSGSCSQSAIGFGTPLSPIQGTPRPNRSQSDARRPPLAATSSAPLLSLQDYMPEPPSPTDSTHSFSSGSSSAASLFSNTLSSKTSFSTINSKDSSMTLASSFEEHCPTTPPRYARRPSLQVEGRLSCMSLHTTYASPESVERTGTPKLEVPRSPTPMQRKASLASLRAGGMDLDSPFNEEFPQW